jgi:AcrR family transcriptional regulator
MVVVNKPSRTRSPRANSRAEPPALRRRFRGLEAEQRQSQRRAKLLEAGVEVFGTLGFHAVGVRDICTQAKLTERYFYESFKNREALFAAVYQLAVERVRSRVSAALGRIPHADGPTLTRLGLRTTLEMYRDDPRLARILLIEVFGSGVGDAALVVSQTYADLIGQLTVGLHPTFNEQQLDLKLLAHGLYGSTLLIAMRWALDGFREPLECVLDCCALFYQGIFQEVRRRLGTEQPVKPKPKLKRMSQQSAAKPKRRA